MSISEKLDRLQGLLQAHSNDPGLSAFFDQLKTDIAEHERQLEILSIAGAELSKEQDQRSALALILYTARNLTNADAGTVYSVLEEYHDHPFNPGELKSKSLVFEEMHTESRRYFNSKPKMPPVPMEVDGQPNYGHVSAYCANTGKIVNIPDVYNEKGFDFSGTRKYDEMNDYRSQSMLVLPLRDHENRINGVLQLINRQKADGTVVPFTKNDQTIVQAMSYQAAISLTTQQLLQEHIRLFDAFVRVLAEGLGEKSPYNFGHINRVAELSVSLAEEINTWNQGHYRDIQFDRHQMEEIRLSGWMHDIGKLTTPEHVVSKPVKLQLICDRIELVVERFNAKIKDVEIDYLNQKLSALKAKRPPVYYRQLEKDRRQAVQDLIEDLKALTRINFGGESLAAEDRSIIERAAATDFRQHIAVVVDQVHGEQRTLDVSLAPEAIPQKLVNGAEKTYLSIDKGTLSPDERKIISDHADRSWRWLMRLPFPRKKMKLPLYAGAHHETLNGKGYPNRLKAHQLPIQSRIIAVADIFEALTANDRPYKKPMQLAKALTILGNMVKAGELDAEVVRIFLKSGLYRRYAHQFLDPNQLVEIDVDQWLQDYYPKRFTNAVSG